MFPFFFKDNQRDLESATEKLSEYLERDITSENLADIKQKVQSYVCIRNRLPLFIFHTLLLILVLDSYFHLIPLLISYTFYMILLAMLIMSF